MQFRTPQAIGFEPIEESYQEGTDKAPEHVEQSGKHGIPFVSINSVTNITLACHCVRSELLVVVRRSRPKAREVAAALIIQAKGNRGNGTAWMA